MKPSVTKLLDLLNKPALISWANKQGLLGNNILELRKNSFKNGNNIHNQIDRYIKNGVPFDDISIQHNYEYFFSNKTIINNEFDIETEYFVGRVDISYIDNNLKWICDFKLNQNNIYFENILQLVSYSMAIECDKIGIISVPDFKLHEIHIKNIEYYKEIIISLSNIYKYKNLIENGN